MMSVHNEDLKRFLTPAELRVWAALNDPERLQSAAERLLVECVVERRAAAQMDARELLGVGA